MSKTLKRKAKTESPSKMIQRNYLDNLTHFNFSKLHIIKQIEKTC